MVTEKLLGMVASLWLWLVDLLPDWEMPAGILDPGGLIETVSSLASTVGVWVEWSFVIPVGFAPFYVWTAGLIWKLGRTLFSHVPLFGGAG
jgi:hypothetical protein